MTNPKSNPKPKSQNPTQGIQEERDFGNGVKQEHIKISDQRNKPKQETNHDCYIGDPLSCSSGPFRPVFF